MRYLILLIVVGISLTLPGCGTVREPDRTLIPTQNVDIPDELRQKCRASPLPERSIGEEEVLEYIASLFDVIDVCDNKRNILVNTIDQLKIPTQ